MDSSLPRSEITGNAEEGDRQVLDAGIATGGVDAGSETATLGQRDIGEGEIDDPTGIDGDLDLGSKDLVRT